MVTEDPAQVRLNAALLREARERANLAIQEAVGRLNKLLKRERSEPITDEQLRSWEQGDGSPSLVEAEQLAKAYFVSFVTLFQPELPPANVTDFRLGPEKGRRAPLSYETREKLNRFSARLYLVAKRISVELGISEEVSIPEAHLDDLRSAYDIEALATRVRASLGISDELQLSWESDTEAFTTWRDKVEGTGAFVFSFYMPVDECRGASKWEAGGPPAILVNSGDATTAQLFTLLHEFAHLMLADRERNLTLCDPSEPAMAAREERVANRFAAAVLLPRELLDKVLPHSRPSNFARWPQSERRRIRGLLNVSQAAIAIRLVELELIGEAGMQSFWRRPSGFARGKNIPVWRRYRQYLGARATRLARHAVEGEAITTAELSRVLDIKVRDVEALLG